MLLLSRTIASASPFNVFLCTKQSAGSEPGRVSLRMGNKAVLETWSTCHLNFQSINLSNAAVSESATRIKRWLLLWSLQCDMFSCVFSINQTWFNSSTQWYVHISFRCWQSSPVWPELSKIQCPMQQISTGAKHKSRVLWFSFDLHQEVMKIYLCFSVHNYTFQLVREMTSLLTKHTAGVCSCSTARTDSKIASFHQPSFVSLKSTHWNYIRL